MTAAILILITLCQLMLTPSASILNEVINDVTLLKNELNTLMAQHGSTMEMSASGEFVRPPKVDTTIIKNKLHELQNNVTKLAEAISNKNQNVDDIKNRISTMEKEIENLNKLYDNKDREITQTLAKLQNIISDLMAKYLTREQEFAKLQYDEFLGAIKHRFYKFAAVKFVTMKNETSAVNFVRTVYEEIGDLPSILEFAGHVDGLKRKLLIYRAIANSNTFVNSLESNIILFLNKLIDGFGSNKITEELKEIIKNMYHQLDDITSKAGIRFCWKLQKNVVVERYYKPKHPPGPYDSLFPAYCHPVDSIYGVLPYSKLL